MDGGNRTAVEGSLLLGAVVESDHRDVNGGAVEDPFPVTHGEKDAARLLDALEYCAICPAADALCGEETGASGMAGGDLGAGLLKPIAAEVGFGRHSASPSLEKGIDICVAKFTA